MGSVCLRCFLEAFFLSKKKAKELVFRVELVSARGPAPATQSRGGDPGLGRLLPKHLQSGEAVWGLPWGHKSGPQLFVGIGTIATRPNGLILVLRPLKTLRWRGSPFLDAACAPCRPSCGGCGGAPAQAPHRLRERAPTEHLMRAAHRTRTLNSAFFLKRQIVIRGR